MRLVSKILVTLGIFAGVVPLVTITSCGPQEEEHTHTFAEEWTHDDTHHWHPSTCGHDVKSNEEEHTFTSVVTDPTYESGGYTTYTCSVCGYSYRGDETSQLEHNYSSTWSHDEDSHWRACIDEGYEHLRADEENHSYVTSVTDPTYESGGYTTYTCSVCGYSYTDSETSPLSITITWQNYDGTILEVDNDVPYGSIPSYDGETPKKDDDGQYSYTFSGWSPEVSEVVSDITYTAQFTSSVNSYTVTWQNYDGTILEVDNDVPYGSMPSYDGETPKKDSDGQYSCTFSGWSPEVSEVVGDITYIAQFTSSVNSYTVTWQNYDGSILEVDNDVPYGSMPCYDGETPRRDGDNQYSYTFVSWSPEVSEVVCDVTYVAQFSYGDDLTYTLNSTNDGYVVSKGSNSANYIDIVIPERHNNLPIVGIVDDAFSYCYKLTSICIPSSVTSIGEYAFYRCTSLTSVVIPTSVTSIGSLAFYRCTSLTIYCEASSLPSGWNSGWNSHKPVVWNYQGINGVTEDGFKYAVTLDSNDNKCITITGYTGEVNDIKIPSTVSVNGQALSVKEICENAFYGCSSLTSVTFAENSQLESIGYFAFYGCTSLTSIVIPTSVTSIDYGAFFGCNSLTIYCEASSLPSGWNSGWNSRKPVVWNYQGINGVTEDGFKYAVTLDSNSSRCISIVGYVTEPTNLVIPSRISVSEEELPVKEICENAFSNCSSLTSVTFAENSQLESIGRYAFWDCSSLTSIVIPTSVTSIDSFAFSNCSSLNIYCEASSLPSGCNSGWNFQKPVVWNYQGINGVTEDSFKYAVTLDSNDNKCITITGYTGEFSDITIPSTVSVNGQALSVKEICENAFYCCTSLNSVTFAENSQLESIGQNAFWGCTYLNSINIPSSVISIGRYAFSRCTSLTFINIPNSVNSIGDFAFRDCTSLTSVTFAENSQLESIGYSAFNGCTSLTSIVIPTSVTSIDYSAFYGCSSLTIYCKTSSKPSGWGLESDWNVSNRPVVWNYQGINGVTEDGFKYAVTLDSNSSRCISIVGYVGKLTDIVVPSAINIGGEELLVEEICENAFHDYSSLASIVIPNSVNSIGYSAFNGCTSLTSVTFAENSQLESIGEYAFCDCTSLTSISIPNSVSSIGSAAFCDCTSLTSVVIPNSVNHIYMYTFCDCTSLTSISIPNSVSSISWNAFDGCTSLTSIYIPSSVNYIGWYAFNECGSLTIYCEVSSQPSGWDSNWNYSNCPVVWNTTYDDYLASIA